MISWNPKDEIKTEPSNRISYYIFKGNQTKHKLNQLPQIKSFLCADTEKCFWTEPIHTHTYTLHTKQSINFNHLTSYVCVWVCVHLYFVFIHIYCAICSFVSEISLFLCFPIPRQPFHSRSRSCSSYQWKVSYSLICPPCC